MGKMQNDIHSLNGRARGDLPGHAIKGQMNAAVYRPSTESVERRFEKASVLYHAGRLKQALVDIEIALSRAEATGNTKLFIECCTLWVRILAELEQFDAVERIQGKIQALLAGSSQLDLPASLRAKAIYTLGICHCYQAANHEQAVHLFREAVDVALAAEDKDALAFPLYGTATVMYARGRYVEALNDIDRLEVLLSCHPNAALSSASFLLKALIYRNQGDLIGAMAAAWKAFESLRQHPEFSLYLHNTILLAQLHALKREPAQAKAYTDLVARLLHRDDFPRLARLYDDVIKLLGPDADTDFDLHFDVRTGILKEKFRGEVRFEGQFVLRDLLFLFLRAPGHVFSKEDLARAVWNEPYQPEQHDNKIYVTIKRLRQMIEPSENGVAAKQKSEQSKNDYIIRDKLGYFLNPSMRVKIDGQN
jgi:tetratricopeptide (TPR) repeat protein